MMRAVWNPQGPITAEIEKAAMDRLERAGEVVAASARQKVPIGKARDPYKTGKEWTARKAGALRDSIRVTRLKDDAKQNIRVYAGNKEVYYARFVEYGTVKMKAKPYLRPALNGAKGQIMAIMEGG